MLKHAEALINVGKAPDWNRMTDPYGQTYSRNWYTYRQKEVKAIAKAHLYLHSLKPKMKAVQNFLRWHPTSDEYQAIQQYYEYLLSEAKNNLKRIKNELPLNKLNSEMSNEYMRYHTNVMVPVTKSLLKQMNDQQKNAKEIESLANELVPTSNNEGMNELRKKMKANANAAWKAERQGLENILTGKVHRNQTRARKTRKSRKTRKA
jgi:hypothetical protein